MILETTFTTDQGRVRLLDLMPPKADPSKVVRIVEGMEGEVEMRSELVARFDYGTSIPWGSRLEEGAVSMVAGASMLMLRTAVPMRGEAMKTVGSFSVARPDRGFRPFPSDFLPGSRRPRRPSALLKQAEDFWRDWSSRCKTAGPYSEAVQRSLITLKALTFVASAAS